LKWRVSPSKLSKLLRCERLYYYIYREGLRPVYKLPRLGFGGAISKGLAAYYKGNDPLVTYEEEMRLRKQEVMEAPLACSRQEEILIEYEELFTKGRTILLWYIDWAKENDDFRVLEVETEREIDLGTVILTIIPDLVIERQGEKLCMEHKIRSRYSPRPWSFDLQSKLYCLGTNCLGTLYNFILYRKGEIVREIIPRTDTELEDVKALLMEIAKRVTLAESNPNYLWLPSYSSMCNCEYTELCMAEFQGLDTSYLRENLFKGREEVKEVEIDED